jgi:hypothetical protein
MSKIINFDTVKIVVEKALRDNGFGGTKIVNGVTMNIDNGWKDDIIGVDGKAYSNPQNLKKLRDAIAEAITQSLTSYLVSGPITTGNNIQTGQVVQQTDGSVYLNADLTSKGAARVNDKILISAIDATAFWTWATNVNICASLPSPTPVQVAAMTAAYAAMLASGIDGKIVQGSSTVKIGD